MLGLAATAVPFAALTAVLAPPGLGYAWLRPAFAVLAVGLAAAVGVAIAVLPTRPASLRAAADLVTGVWRNPPRHAYLFVFGLIASLPLWALHTRVVLNDADSARIIATALYVQRTGLRYFVEMQDNVLPHLFMGPAVRLGGIPAAKAVSIVTLQVLCGTVSYLTWRMSRSALGAAASLAALLSWFALAERATVLPLYPAMLALGCWALFVGFRASRTTDHPWRWAFAAAALLIAALEAHTLGQLFVVLMGVLIVTGPPRRTVPALVRIYAAFGVLFVPRAIVNLLEGGFSRFLGNRDDYWLTEGYLVQIQKDFWHLPVRTSLAEWFSSARSSLPNVIGWDGLVVVVLAVVGIALSRPRARAFALGCAGFLIAIIVYKRVPLYPRYLSQLLVGASIAAGGGVALLRRRNARLARVAAVSAVALLTVFALDTLTVTITKTEDEQHQILAGPLPHLAAAIDDGRGVIGARAGHLTFVDPFLTTYGGQFLTEAEFVTYLTWPSDEAVIDVLQRHNIGWVLVSPKRELELGYHRTWVEPAHGRPVRHPEKVKQSPAFCLDTELEGYRLYRLGACRG